MKTKILAILMMLTAAACAGDFLDALAEVESGGNVRAVGDGGNSVGIYQIRKIYVDDVNRISGRRYTYADRKDPVKSREMVKIYLGYYGGVYTHTTGKAVTYDVLAAIHNGGPYGWRKSSTRRFQAKVRTAMLARSRFTAARR